MEKRGGMVHIIAGCYDCGKEWQTRNANGLAAQHAKKYGHSTWVEMGISIHYNPKN